MTSIGPPPTPPDEERRRALAKVYDLLLRLAAEKDNALSGNFGEATEKALEQTPKQVEACDA